MAEVIGMTTGTVERFPGAFPATSVSDELGRIMAVLRGACPPETQISFSFDGRLQVHLDVRQREHVLFVEMMLPTLEAGRFDGITIGGKPGHPFHHRISANVCA
jgi:hypothetical protein